MKHLRYFKYVVRHKWFVFYAGLKTGASLWRLIIHDWSKFSSAEWMPYVNFFYGDMLTYTGVDGLVTQNRRPEVKDAFSRAFHHHIHRNPHHWEYWLRYKAGDETFTPLEMPEKFVREMVADWAGAGRAITGTWDLAEWYDKNRERIKLHKATRERVRVLVKQLSRTLETR